MARAEESRMPSAVEPAYTAEEVIELLGLRPHPAEGGYFDETYRSAPLPPEALPFPASRARHLKTAIYYFLTPDTFSAMHRLPGDEVFHHYLGDTVRQLQLFPDGSGRVVRIGTDLRGGARPQILVPGGVWQGALLESGPHRFALLGTTMSPGFDYADFEAGKLDALATAYPAWREEIARLVPTEGDGVSPHHLRQA